MSYCGHRNGKLITCQNYDIAIFLDNNVSVRESNIYHYCCLSSFNNLQK